MYFIRNFFHFHQFKQTLCTFFPPTHCISIETQVCKVYPSTDLSEIIKSAIFWRKVPSERNLVSEIIRKLRVCPLINLNRAELCSCHFLPYFSSCHFKHHGRPCFFSGSLLYYSGLPFWITIRMTGRCGYFKILFLK